MHIYSYRFPKNYSQSLIGTYDQSSGDSPHDLIAFGLKTSWRPPSVSFEVSLEKIDLIPATNLPLALVRADLGQEIADVSDGAVDLIPVVLVAGNLTTKAFSILHPSHHLEIWDLAKSDWLPLDTPDWPKDRPMFMKDMILKTGTTMPVSIAYNKHWPSMIVFNEQIAKLIRNSGSWVEIYTPSHYCNQ